MRKRDTRPYRPYSGRKSCRWVIAPVCVLLALVLTFGGLLGYIGLHDRDRVVGEPRLMIVLGCQVMSYGPSVLLRDRLDKALVYLDSHPDTIVVVSGAQGINEPTTEAQCMFDYLTAHGYPAEQILLEGRSFNTDQNLRYSLEVLTRAGYDVREDVIVVSQGTHLSRIRMLWGRLFGGTDNLSTLAAPATHRASAARMLIREPFALIKSFLLDRGEPLRTTN